MNQKLPDRSNRRRDRRRSPKGRIKVICQKGTVWLGMNLAVSVLDISETGVRLAVKGPLARGEEVSLTFEGMVMLRPLQRLGTVVWSLPLADGSHVIGIDLQRRLQYSEFLHMT
jgi:hypothetical protein